MIDIHLRSTDIFYAGHHMTRNEDGVLSPEDSDLAQLRSLNEGELTADWYNFQVRVKEPNKFQIITLDIF